MQAEFDSESPEFGIRIIGINEVNQEHGNENMTDGRDLPWLQDVDLNDNRKSDISRELWDTVQRDLVILDADGEKVGDHFSLTTNPLESAVNYNTLKQMILDAVEVEQDSAPWQNKINPLDVNGDNAVSPNDALQIINYLISDGAGELPAEKNLAAFLDPSGDNFVSPRDALLVINRLIADNAAEGEPSEPSADIQVSVDNIDAAFASRIDSDGFDFDDDLRKSKKYSQ